MHKRIKPIDSETLKKLEQEIHHNVINSSNKNVANNDSFELSKINPERAYHHLKNKNPEVFLIDGKAFGFVLCKVLLKTH